jgi:serine/threonine protein kinase
MDEQNYTPGKSGGSKYQILMELGRGGMGVVHLAMSRGPRGFTKLLVLKIMRRELVGDDELHRMFLEEARISARLAHPNIVQLYEVSDHEGSPTIVMEYLEGQPLSSIVVGAPAKLPLPLHLYILSKTLAGLHAAHEQRDYDGSCLDLIHRDVSPHNIFVLFDGQVKVLDFGIAKAAGSEVETQTGLPKGKIRYMPPEQLMRDRMDRRADIFAVGVILWEALAGRRLWANREEGEITRALLARDIPALPDDVDIPPVLRTICARAMAPDPADRYATAEELQRDLERYLAGQPIACGAEEVGAFLRQHLGHLRAATKKVIDFHIKTAERIANSGNTPSGTAVRRRYPATPEPGAQGTPPSAAAADLRTPPPAEAQTRAYPSPNLPATAGGRSRWSRAIIAGLGIGALFLAVAGAATLHGGRLQRDDRRTASGPRGRQSAAMAMATPSQKGGGAGEDDGAGPGAVAASCGAGFKLCGGQCVSIDRPDFGCGGESCLACGVVNATARCNQQHECDIAVCYQAFDDCDGDRGNGCETNVRTEPDHCGGCKNKCPPLPNATRGCGDACTIWRCEAGFSDCDGSVSNGCEVGTTNDPANCGHCGVACKAGHRCRQGECVR